jgi:hypothetical protein
MRRNKREDLLSALPEVTEMILEVWIMEFTITSSATRLETLLGSLMTLLVVMNSAGIAQKVLSVLPPPPTLSLVKLVTCALTALDSLTLAHQRPSVVL